MKTSIPVSLAVSAFPASFEEFRAEKNNDNLPPPYTLEYVSTDDIPLESPIESELNFELERESELDIVLEQESELDIEQKRLESHLKDSEDDGNKTTAKSSYEFGTTFISKKNTNDEYTGEVESANVHLQVDHQHADNEHVDNEHVDNEHVDHQQTDYQPEFAQEEYEQDEVSLEDLDNHYAGITANFSEVHMPFLEEAHASIFPPQSKDLFLGQNKDKEELEYQFIDWEAFVEYCISHDFPEEYMPYIRLSSAKINGDECILRISSSTALHQLNVVQKEVEKFLVAFLGRAVEIRYAADVYERRTLAEMMEAMHEHPQIKMLQKEFGANLLRCSCLKTEYKEK